jgi:uncharacterized membrane protein
MLAVVFDDETKAYEGSSALKELDSEGSISVHSEAVVKKNPDGSLTTKEIDSDFPIRTAEGTAIGALIGVLGGPIGVGVLGATGALAGYIADLHRVGVDADYVDEVSTELTPGKWAVVSDISEEWETPVDTKMRALGGSVFRATRESVQKELDAKDQEALKAEIDHLKKEQAQAQQNQKAKIQTKIDHLSKKLQTKVEGSKKRSEQERKETEAKIQALEEKAKKANSYNKAKIEARVASLRQKLKESA